MKKALLFLILFFLSYPIYAQTYNMSNNFVTNNSGTIYDSGGPNGTYGNNQDFVFTICPNDAPSCWGLAFSQFNLEDDYDFLTIYAGSTTSSSIVGTYTGTNSPGVVQATGSCLTMEFTSDFSVTYSGFEAIWGECPDADVAVPVCPDADIAANDTTVCPSSCVDLEVEIVETANTTSYVVENIPYDPLPFNVGIVQNVPIDDTWSSVVNINFNFCFYGNTYNQLVVGTNGLISFNTAYAGQYCQWPINDPFPSNNNPINCIGAPYHDIDPAVGGTMRYGTYGEAPCRAFIITWQNVPMYQCNNITATQQIILYETSNIIDTYIENKPLCAGWNGGAAIQGIQNANGTQATVVPGRNFPAQWTATNDGKRFRPNGTPTYDLTWYENGVTPIGNSSTITVCPDEETNYMAEAVYTNCDGSTIIANDTVTVTTSDPFEVTATQNDVSCSSGNNGSITVTPTGGSGNYSYNWSNFQTTSTINNLGAGTYIVTITDNITPACPLIETYTIALAPPLTANIVSTDAICDGATGSSIDLTVSGGTTASGNYTYTWNNGLPNQEDHTNIASGNYSVTVTDDNGCTAVASTTVNVSPGLTIDLTANDADCGLSNGSLNLSINGGTPFYTYDWSDNTLDGTQNPINIPSGTYSVTVSDINGCSDNATVTINDNPPPTVSIFNIDANCEQANGQAIATVANGLPPYTYLWNTTPPQNTPNADNLTAGSYTVTVTDANGCTVSENVTIGDTPLPTVSATPTDSNCGLPDGSATATAANGTPPYSFSWNTSPPQNTATANNLATGSYSVTVTDNIGCTAETTVTIGENPPPTATTDVLDANCDQNDGGANVTASGGTPPYSYEWNTTPPATTLGVGNLVTGTYTVTVTDANGCTVEASATVGNNPPPTVSANSTDATCSAANGSLSATGNGGTPPYSFSWASPINANNATVNNVPTGNYSVVLTDANGCTAETNVSVGDSDVPSISATPTDATCGDDNGSATASASGGTPPYSFSWASPINSNNATVNNLPEGTYTVSVSDANGCTAETNVTIGNSPALNGSIDTEDANCGQNDGNATVNATGGTPPYSYAWSSPISSNAATANDLVAGNYSVTVTDNIGCTVVAPITINDIPGPTATTNTLDANCGQADGGVNVTANGGTPPYSYEWNTTPPATTLGVPDLAAGSYTVTVTDANGCTVEANATVNDIPGPTATTNTLDANCGQADGGVNVTANGGTPPYSYEWNTTPPATTSGVPDLAAGSYTVTVTDANGCTVVANATVSDLTGPSVSLSNIDALCDEPNGSATATASGGTPPYSYEWNTTPTQTTATASNLGEGSYTVVVTDNVGCVVSDNITISNSPPPSISATPTDATCGDDNGSATATASGGTPPYSFSWASPINSNNATVNNLPEGTYTVSVSDANGCTAETNVTIGNSPPLNGSIDTEDANCGQNDGNATVNATGGTPPYSYTWSSPISSNAATANDLVAGNYSVTVTDNIGCTVVAPITINDIPGPTATTNTLDANCGQADGGVNVTANGGTPPYSYEWNTTPPATTLGVPDLAAGSYTVTVTDANGCTVVANATVNDIPGPTATTNTLDANCGQADGGVNVTANGGTPPYSYEWNTTPPATTLGVPNLAAGSYTVTVTDANGCTVVANATVSDLTGPSVSLSNIDALCDEPNGSATATASGGTPPYSYEWNTTPTQTTATASNLTEGNYTVTVTDNVGCVITDNISISNSPPPTANISGIDATCGDANGSASVTASGGLPPYTYAWGSPISSTTATANNLDAGSYSVTVSDANGCTVLANISITNTPPLNGSIDTENANCGQNDGSATANASGGTPPYTYTWSSPISSTTATASDLTAGNYSITVTDAIGCTIVAPIVINDIPGPTANTDAVDATCGEDNGQVSVTVSGGSSPYTYVWSTTPPETTNVVSNIGVGNYTVTVTDANNCTLVENVAVVDLGSPTATITPTDATCNEANGSITVNATDGLPPYTYAWNTTPPQTTTTVNNLDAGDYTVTITDANGCNFVTQASITNTPAVEADISSENANCGQADGTASVSATNGTPPYTYLWNDAASQNGTTANNLVTGNYAVTITDAIGCTLSLNINVGDNPPPTVSATFENPTCELPNGSAEATGTGGQGAYTYLWNTTPPQTTAIANNLLAGTYSITITDEVGCTASTSVTLTDAGIPTATVTPQNATCGDANGQATASANAGTPPYTYLWNDVNASTTTTITDLAPNTYIVTVTDALGCTNTAEANVIDNSAPTSDISGTDPTCELENGDATVTVSGGLPPYNYIWSDANAQTTATANNLAFGTYTVTVTDGNGCVVTNTIILNESELATIVLNNTDASCDLPNGEIFAEVSGGTPPYTYLWNDANTQTTATANNLDIGTYSVTITDDIGCTISAETTLSGTTAPSVDTDFVTATCDEANGIATALATGGQPPYSFTWSSIPVQNTENATDLAEGIYSVTITDANNCTASQTVEIPNIPAPTADITPQNANCGEPNGQATVNVNGNTAPYTYEWNTTPTQNTQTAINLLAGNYEVTVTDANNCNAIVNIDIIDTGSPSIDELVGTDPICDEPNGNATVTVSGGTPPYTYEWLTTPIQTNPTATNLGEGTFTINVTDLNGCLVSSNITLTNTPSPTATATATLSSCAAPDGSATVVANGGTPPYSYEWNTTPSQFAATATDLGQGSYTATVTDALGCTATAQASVTIPPSPTLATTYTPDECAAGIATATVSVSGGSTPYSYVWDDINTQNTQTATNLTVGIYYVTVTDAAGCSAVENVVIDGTTPPTIEFGTINENCGQANGEAAAIPSGGLPPYTYLWNTFPTQGTSTVVNLVAGDYTVTVTDANGCTAVETTTILDEGAPVAEIIEFTNPACGVENGEATVSVTGGNPPFSYSWIGPDGFSQTTQTIEDLASGTYNVTVTDQISCTASTEIALTSPNAPTVQMSILQTTCGQDNGSATAIVTGGEEPFLYFWSVGGVPTDATTVENIPPGPYTLSVVDGNGCNVASSFIIETSDSPSVILSAENTICGQNNGSASAVASGGNPPYSYEWNTSPIQFTTDISDLSAGNYSVTITDANGCSTSENIDVEPSAGPTIDDVTTINSNCNQADGSASVIVSGGTGNITYLWENGFETADISNLVAGSYGITVSDDLGCSTESIAIVSDDGAPTADISGVNPTCNEANGSASVVVSGGSGTYTYEWNGDANLNMADLSNVAAGEHTVVITDVNGCIVTASITLTDDGVPTAAIEPQATLCGLNNGAATAIADFGTPPYTYLWSENNLQTENIQNLAAGEYFLTITDAIGCTATASTTVETSEELQVFTDGIAATCGLPNGEAAVVPINGQVPHTYLWDNNFVTSIATGLFAGDYAVTVTDANLCSASVIVTVAEILPPILNATKTDATCGLDNGSIAINIDNGTPPFSYIWNDANEQTTATATNLAAGNYTVTVTDDNDCEVIITESIVNIETPTATLAFTQATCGQNNATVTVTTLSGIPPFSYAWNASTQTTEMITGVAPSLVSVTVTDANNCTFVEQINVTAENSPTATITDFVSPTCGNANGSATVSASGGVPPYSYVWNSNPPQNNLIANNLTAGNYIVTVTDGNGCIATANIDLVNIAGPTISLSAIDATCQQSNGSAMVSVNGGTAPFIYLWDDSNAQNTETAINLASGNYSITVTDANNCSAVENISIGDSDIPTISISTTNASCGQNDGEATASGLGGVPPYSFVWDANANNQTTATASNLFAGAYTVTITDANGCQNTEIANIIDENAPSATTSTTNEICGQQNGTASVSTAGGLPPFSYLWNDANAQTTEIATNLAAGTYSIEVTDANGCVATATAIVEETAGATLDISNVSATCGQNNASASVVTNGGLPPYTYLWNDTNAQTAENAIDLFSGIYEVTVTDANGCTASISTTISDTELPTATTITTNSVCGQAVGEATAQATNGTPPYTYLWNDTNAQTGISATGLSAGVYEVTITDAAGCTTSTSATINDEGSPTLTTTSVMPTCNSDNGEASVSVNGNSAPYTYVWNTTPPQTTQTATNLFAGTYLVDVTDVNNCLVSAEVTLTNIGGPTLSLSSDNSTCGDANGTATVTTDGIAAPYTYVWSDANAQTTETATNLLAGTYFVTLTDVNNCETVGEILVEDIAGPSVSITPVSASCSLANGEAMAIPQNGTAPYTFAWNDGNGQTTETAINLAAADYEVTITDANGCTASANTTILDTPIPTVTAVSTNANCELANGTATATAVDGIAPYSFVWDANANAQTTATAIDLLPNTYSVTVTDVNGCTAETSITVGDDGSPTVSLAATNPTCELNNGQAVATAANGLAPYTYLWNDANAQTTATAENLVAGTYTLTVTDANGCEIIDSIILTDNGNPTAVLSSISATCGNANGSATVVASVGTAPYTYAWSDGVQTSETATNLAQGNYTVTVTDANGCEAIESILVENIDGPSATTTTVSATCALADGSATVTAIDGTAPYTYAWNDANGQTTETATNLPTGIYEVTVTDANDCIFVTTAEVVGFMLPPVITCGESTTSSVTFEWENVSGAIEYEISIDGNFVETVDASILIYTVTGLSSGQDVEISIVAVGEAVCGISEATNHTCQSLPCPDIPLTINGLDEIYCDYDENVILVGEPAGGIFSGTGIVGTAFSPSLAGVGTHEINYFYSQDNCQYDTTYVVQISNVTVSTTPTTTILETPEAVTIDAIAISGLNGEISYEWSPTESLDCSDCESVVATPIENTEYTVVATDEYGCSANSVSFINFDFNNILVIPNAFSPNGDNENDIFRVKGLNVTEVELYIYNRWGELVFEDKTTDLAQGWDGKFKDEDCEIGVYVFYAIARFVDGSEEFTKGNVTLIR